MSATRTIAGSTRHRAELLATRIEKGAAGLAAFAERLSDRYQANATTPNTSTQHLTTRHIT